MERIILSGVDMTNDVYIFGYQSILAPGSLAASVHIDPRDHQFIPARLKGYARCWNATRDFGNNAAKRYVHTDDWRVAGRVAFATLTGSQANSVNGICWRISSDRLPDLDFREQGYNRIDVSRNIAPYPGFELSQFVPCYAYVDPAPDPVPAVVSKSYYDMGRVGAALIDRQVPNFLSDYLSSTEPPQILDSDLAFVFFSGDGHHLWLLEENDSSLILLHKFSLPQIRPSTRAPPECLRHVTAGLEWLDARHRCLPAVSNNKRIPSGMVRDLRGVASGENVFASPYWLCRLIAADAAPLKVQIDAFANDIDPWVRRTVQIRRGAL
jgi:hypothetical protein